MLCGSVNATKTQSLLIILQKNYVKKMTRLSGGIQNVTNSKVKLPSKIGEAHGSTDISVMWKDHYSRIFSTVNESNCTALYADLCDEHYLFETGMCVTPNEIADIVAEMSCNKSPGLDGLTSEHLKKANCQLSVLLSILLSALLVHGRVLVRDVSWCVESV